MFYWSRHVCRLTCLTSRVHVTFRCWQIDHQYTITVWRNDHSNDVTMVTSQYRTKWPFSLTRKHWPIWNNDIYQRFCFMFVIIVTDVTSHRIVMWQILDFKDDFSLGYILARFESSKIKNKLKKCDYMLEKYPEMCQIWPSIREIELSWHLEDWDVRAQVKTLVPLPVCRQIVPFHRYNALSMLV